MAGRSSVLVVEDDSSWRTIYQEILEEEGYRVGLAASQAEAWQILDECTYDVAIIDLRLADNDPQNTDGIAVARMLRDRGVPTRVIVKSSYLTQPTHIQLKQLGVFAIVDKDGDIEQLLELVAGALGGS
jgi:DNA-binding NtrC family response regulator